MEHRLTLHPLIALKHRRRGLLVQWLYFCAIVREFRWTLLTLALAVAFGACLYHIAPSGSARDNSWLTCIYGGWMALVAAPLDSPPREWYLKVLCCIYPILGFVLLGEGIVRLSLLMVSRRRGEKEWMLVTASTYRNHVILCGLGHLGFRVLEQLRHSGVEVVCIEQEIQSRLVNQAKAMGVAVLTRDMTEDQALLDAGVEHARAIVVATNNDIANLEVALDARRFNHKIRVILHLFDQALAAKVSEAMSIDAAFSASTLAAPVVAQLALGGRVVSASSIAGVQYLIAEVNPKAGSELAGKSVAEVESRFPVRVLAIISPAGQTQSPPVQEAVIAANDRLVFHTAANRLADLSAACVAGAGQRAAAR